MKQIAKKNKNLENTVEFSNQLSQNSDYNDVTKEFQKGAIYYSHLNSKTGQSLSYIYEDRYENWEQIGVESSLLGFQVSQKITDNNGISISYFELGAIVSGTGIPEPIICRYMFPKIGNPGIVSPDKSYEIKNFIRCKFDPIKKSVYDHIIEENPHFFEGIFSNKFFLRAVSSKSPIDDVLLFPEINIEPIISPVTNEREVIVSMSIGANPSAPLHDKTLFDLIFKCINEFVIAPHGIFANKSWDNFVIMHITDIHVSRRLEYVKDDLKKMSVEKPDLVDASNIHFFNNFNNNFRDFISYANSLHKNGSLDCILATGDLVDYIFDSTEQTARTPRNPSNVDKVNGNNFDFFKNLILGLEPGRDGTNNEKLLVPVFTSLGNHDYRDMPYCWHGIVDLKVKTIKLDIFPPTNLLKSEAKALEGGSTPEFSTENAEKMAHVDINLPQYDTINSKRSYIVNLGPHRIVMLDSAQDIGILAGVLDAIAAALGWLNQDETRFKQANPNSKGVQQEHVDLVNQALEEAGSTGIVIVGIHAPLIDMSYYPHYLRESDRFALDQDVMERGFPYFSPFRSIVDEYNGTGKKPTWPTINTPFFKFGRIDFTLENGVSKGLNEKFLEICAGIGVSRKVDLVLSGHGHKNVEFRLEFESDKKNLFFHDYYTENPARYYASILLPESDYKAFLEEIKPPFGSGSISMFKHNIIFKKYQAKMKGHPTVPKDGVNSPTFVEVHDNRGGGEVFIFEEIHVKPYPTPLNKTNDKIGWWTKHRPLFIETAALGPIETFNNTARKKELRLSHYSLFHGCRKITIKNNVISSIETITMNEIRGPRPRLCSLKELCRIRGVSFPASLRSLAADIKRIPPISERLKIGE